MPITKERLHEMLECAIDIRQQLFDFRDSILSTLQDRTLNRISDSTALEQIGALAFGSSAPILKYAELISYEQLHYRFTHKRNDKAKLKREQARATAGVPLRKRDDTHQHARYGTVTATNPHRPTAAQQPASPSPTPTINREYDAETLQREMEGNAVSLFGETPAISLTEEEKAAIEKEANELIYNIEPVTKYREAAPPGHSLSPTLLCECGLQCYSRGHWAEHILLVQP